MENKNIIILIMAIVLILLGAHILNNYLTNWKKDLYNDGYDDGKINKEDEVFNNMINKGLLCQPFVLNYGQNQTLNFIPAECINLDELCGDF